MFLGFRREWGGSSGCQTLSYCAAGRASRAVKYHGFATPPLKNFKKDITKTLGTEIDINMRASAGLYIPDHIHRCPVMPYISRKILAEIFIVSPAF